jgi:serine phosphatase RsbU (regulator of sigma subunit)
LRADGTLEVASAGHPPPIIAPPKSQPYVMQLAPGPPLFGRPRASAARTTTTVPPGSVLVFYTDGLVERRDEPLDITLEALAARLDTSTTTLDDLLEHIVDLHPSTTNDDMAILLVRTPD